MDDENRDDHAAALALAGLLDVAPGSEAAHFTGARRPGGTGRVYGGQVIGQALMAAAKTVAEDRLCHSLHCYFMRPASENHEIDFTVDADMDGRAFSNRRVVARQGGKPIFNMIASFQIREEGLHHQAAMPDVPPPDDLPGLRLFDRPEAPSSVELRPIGVRPDTLRVPGPAEGRCWFRLVGASADELTGGQAMQRAILAMMSDATLVGTAFRPHGRWVRDKDLQVASIDHALWIHDDVDCTQWLLYATDGPWTGNARAFARGQFFSADGRLVASTAQEGLMRFKPEG